MRSSSAPPRTSRAGRPAPRRGAGRGRRGAHHAFLCLIPQSSRIFSYVAALARLPRPALPVFESFLAKCLKFNLKVTLYHVSNILTHRSGLRSSTHPFWVRGSFKFFAVGVLEAWTGRLGGRTGRLGGRTGACWRPDWASRRLDKASWRPDWASWTERLGGQTGRR